MNGFILSTEFEGIVTVFELPLTMESELALNYRTFSFEYAE